jgi:hypothetical protein
VTTPVPEADAAEQRRPADDGADPAVEVTELDDAAPLADALEQAAPAEPAAGGPRGDVPLEADAADAADQSVEVPADEDEGRA